MKTKKVVDEMLRLRLEAHLAATTRVKRPGRESELFFQK
jgi:hypothetical protein